MTTLQETRQRAQALHSELLVRGDRLRELREKPTDERTADWARDIQDTAAEIRSMDAELSVYERELRGGVGPVAAMLATGQPEFRTMGEAFVGHDEIKEWMTRGAGRGAPSPVIEVPEFRTLITTAGDNGSGSNYLLPTGDRVMPPQTVRRRRLFVRDLVAGGQTNLNSVPFIQEVNAVAWELAASAVPEASAKPEVPIGFTPYDAPVRTIAAWIPVTNQVLEDAPTLRSYIDGRLTYMLLIREEEEMLRGPGTGARLQGLLTVTGHQTQSAVAGDNPATIGSAIAKIEIVDGEPDGLVFNPTDFWAMMTTRHANPLDGGFTDAGLPFAGAPTTVWGLQSTRSRAMTAGHVLVGAFAMGAQVFDRTGITIKVTDSHDDYFIYNKTVILAEERLAFAIHRPDFFVDATL